MRLAVVVTHRRRRRRRQGVALLGSELAELFVLVGDALAHVLLERGRDGEGHVAEATPVDVLAQPAVGLHVAGQLGTLRAGVGAQLALVRLLARVRAPVHGQVGTVFEHLAAVLARVVATAVLSLDGAGPDRRGC